MPVIPEQTRRISNNVQTNRGRRQSYRLGRPLALQPCLDLKYFK